MVRGTGRAEGAARASVWLEGKARDGRGRQPSGLDRERITATAVRLLDAEGLGKFSMRRLAAELNVTAMSVYWYVDTKDDLLELALDQAFDEMRLPAADSDEDWRDQLRTLAGEYRAVLVRHPWVSPLAGTFLNIGPHALDFSLAVQRVIRRTGLPARGQAGAISAVFQFVYGFGTIEGHFVQRCASAGMTQEEYFRHAMSAVSDTPEPHEVIQHSADLMEARGGDTVEEMRAYDFTYALDTLVAGIEVMAQRG
ncbi:TetR/AcrR family transcriptional regulator [Streptomyces europaeiscabiei]|uniref:TetR/AcrR family transcriptional regulator n=1 Tax=Streptomyces europaeiscabiei TaxID=146819 RepID=UPI0029ADC077|nr:TetR/AcrR family transcriptional regulator [Streptomyces europaeiscabiei]MDX3587970.1 TetR/AcrR family transcriptional regulator [Streptomyces europaeiscabiei]MDX3617919.1 TetR/AcrR family transcriptional regulator [Streptomyces europaeiscabiei]MDX3636643.1 TetR/AcrR family transcriptional regulator [Streptomyces europaeiscabiei]MDX3654728.1 TetR/AcrR family transcriptional regulator [Streptomyces europaeiscabiei]WUD33887.1 TetR/AcrR family transcriptional regulator [Streptomyces europaeisc